MQNEFEDFKKEYEDVFTSERALKKCRIERVSTDIGISSDEYQNMLRSTINEFQLFLYDYIVKIMWLFRRYCYNGKRRIPMRSNGWMLDGSFGVFMRNYVGYDCRFITDYNVFKRIISYFDDFYIDFDISNPFKGKYEYPYEYMNLECLILVYAMPERLELLKRGERRKMKYLEFVDYVINYINCYNEKHGRKYIISDNFRRGLSYYVTIDKK